MMSDNNTEEPGSQTGSLVQEIIYSTPGSWRGPYVRATDKLENGNQGWSVFIRESRILTSAMRVFDSGSLPECKRNEAVLSFTGAITLVADYRTALQQLHMQSVKADAQQVVTELAGIGYPQQTEFKTASRQLSDPLVDFLREFGMFLPLFRELKENLPVACPEATINCVVDDDDEAPWECALRIDIPAATPDLARKYASVTKILETSLAAIQHAIDLAYETDAFLFSAKVTTSF